MAYNVTNLSGVTDLGGIFTEINALSGQILFIMLTLIIFVILFVNFLRHGSSTAFGASSFIIAVIASMFYAMSLIPFIVLFACYILAGIGAVVLFFEKKSGGGSV